MIVKFKSGGTRIIYCITEISLFQLRGFNFNEYAKGTTIMHLPVNWKIDACFVDGKEITLDMVEKKMEIDISLPGSDVVIINSMQTCGARLEAGEKYGHKYLSFLLLNEAGQGIAQLYTDILLDNFPQNKISKQ